MTQSFRFTRVVTCGGRWAHASAIAILAAPTVVAAFPNVPGACDTSPATLTVNHFSSVVRPGNVGGYQLTINGGAAATVKPGETATLVLSGSFYRGFLIRATSTSGTGVGGLLPPAGAQLMSACSPPNSGVGHTTNSVKTSTTVTWTAPSNLANGAVVTFSALVVKSVTDGYVMAPITATVVQPAINVPSVGAWGLIALGCGLVGYAWLRLRRAMV